MAMTANERLRAVEDAVGQLRTELGAAGVALPSLRVDPVSSAGNEPYPLVDLGRCNLDTALRLVAVLHEVRR
ncbi:hypothetical protein [Streptomyces spiramyceticus]|uniref:hypothetical protein n=1 Tax=Streptomyces spiramyceticus TaxID=299717 RepID=UPI00237B420B|nr:hypothetical protein [Streptomyces spiramyceticus]